MTTGGSLPPNSPNYVVRKQDTELLEKLISGEYCYVFNARQMGKSSMRVRVMKKLRSQGCKCIPIDMTRLGVSTKEEYCLKDFSSNFIPLPIVTYSTTLLVPRMLILRRLSRMRFMQALWKQRLGYKRARCSQSTEKLHENFQQNSRRINTLVQG